jgi:D-alanyl-D-alanine carboxypeptidase
MKLPIIASLLLIPSAPAIADEHAEMAAAMDRVMADAFPADEPGAAVLVAKGGEVLFRKGYGLANVELNVPVTPDTVFRLASMTKQFTAVAILMLAEQDKLSLDDPVARFLPAFPNGEAITIAHLLGHESGLFDYVSLPIIQHGIQQDITVSGLIDLFQDRPLEFEPGTRLGYSNSNYILLGAIIEKVSGQTYAEFIEQNIFKPAGMTASCYDEYKRIIPNRAAGYEREDDAWVNARYVSMTEPYAAGGLLSSVNDMFRWDSALYAGKLIKRETLERAFTPFKLKDGTQTDAACGWGISELRGRKAVIHPGGIFGFAGYGLTMPDDRVYVVVLTNCPGRSPGLSNVVAQLGAIALGEPYERKPAIKLTAEQLDRYVGTYAHADEAGSIASGGERTIRREGDTLILDSGRALALIPVSETEFYVQDRFPTRLLFGKDSAGTITDFTLDWPLGPPQKCVKAADNDHEKKHAP